MLSTRRAFPATTTRALRSAPNLCPPQPPADARRSTSRRKTSMLVSDARDYRAATRQTDPNPGATMLDREEYVEQTYFFEAFRERVVDGIPSQEVLARVGEELLSTTNLPLAVSFLNTEIKATGLMGPAMARIRHYFTPFQTFVVTQAERDFSRFPIEQALLILEREARYKSQTPTPAGLFVFQFEALARNRLGYANGLDAIAGDPFYSEDWRDYILTLRTRIGDVDFADLIFVRSAFFVRERKRLNPDYEPKYPVLFGEKEGKIARAHRHRDPLYLFMALQRQLGYPEVPRPKRPDELDARLLLIEQRLAQVENRLKLAEGEIHNDLDLNQFAVKPEDTAGVPLGWGKQKGDD